jgi:hypothetical protein
MAHSDKNIVITPARSNSATDPGIVFSGADASLGPQNITLKVYPTNSGTLSFEGSAGQLFSITNTMTGTIFSVNDVSGVPSIEVLDTGLIRLGQYSGFVAFGNSPAVTAAGSTQATATPITRQVNLVTGGSTNNGVILPQPVGGERVFIRNNLGVDIKVYPQTGGQISNSGVNVGVTLSAGSSLEYVACSSTLWFTVNATYA